MIIAVGSDEQNSFTEFLVEEVKKRGHTLKLIGPLNGTSEVGHAVGLAVASGKADTGVVCCYTGTGVSIAANKVNGVRTALCHDAQTATGAPKWNDANVLALSLRTTTTELAREILDAWFDTEFPAAEKVYVDEIVAIERTR
jgi:ribose 5-phosphate isomerase B